MFYLVYWLDEVLALCASRNDAEQFVKQSDYDHNDLIIEEVSLWYCDKPE